MLAKQSLLSADQSHARSAWGFPLLYRGDVLERLLLCIQSPHEIITDYTHSCVKYLFS